MRRPANREDGFVMVTAIIVLSVTLLVAMSAVALTVSRRTQALRVDRAQRAQQAADAGVQATLYQLNQARLDGLDLYGTVEQVTQALACLPLSLSATAETPVVFAVAGLSVSNPLDCPGSSPAPGTPGGSQPVGQHTAYTATLVPHYDARGRLAPVVVARGVEDGGTADPADDVVRRVAVRLEAVAPFSMIEGGGNVELRGSITSALVRVINGDLSAKKDIKISGPVSASGNLLNPDGSIVRPSRFEYGDEYIGTTVSIGADLIGPPDAEPPTRDPISISPSKPECPGGPCPAGLLNNEKMLVSTSGTITLGAGDYVTCGVALDRGTVLRTSTSGQPTRLYVDSPTSARCAPYAGRAGLGSMAIDGTMTTGLNPTMQQFYVVGNGTAGGTFVRIGPTSSILLQSLSFFLYAPMSNVELRYAAFNGSIIGNDVLLHSPPSTGVVALLSQDLGLSRKALDNAAGVFRPRQYVECSPEPPSGASSPDAGC